MRKRPLGKTGLFVSEMALGTWGLSGDAYGSVEPEEAERVVRRALDVGITLFDTADSYGGGKMEALLGRVLGARTDVVVVTKGGTDRTTEPARKRFDAEYLRGAVGRSLKRLGRDRVELYLLHNPSTESLGTGEPSETMQALVKEGKVAHWGISAGDAESARMALDRGAEVVELAYNLFHAIDLHRIGGDLMVEGAGVLAHSPLAYGLLAGFWTKERQFPEGDHRCGRWTRLELEKRVDQVEAMRFLVHGQVESLRGAAVRFVLANHLVSSAVLGPKSVLQLEELVRDAGAGPVYLPDADLAKLPRFLMKKGILL